LESECRLALATLGLDPGLGFLHFDTPNRDSLACDLMEPVRPLIDGYLFDLITNTPLKKEWFFEERNGNCRLMGSFAVRLSQTAPIWRQAVAPFAEWIARTLSHTISRPNRKIGPPTRLTQRHRRDARPPASVRITNTQHILSRLRQTHSAWTEELCRLCGCRISRKSSGCSADRTYSSPKSGSTNPPGRLSAQARSRKAKVVTRKSTRLA